MVEELARWGKTIPRDRDRAQSRILLWTAGTLVGLSALFPPLTALLHGLSLRSFTAPLLISVGFALLVWALRAATSAAAAMGSLICFILARPRHIETHHDPLSTEHSALLALITLFVLTFAATKFGRKKKEARGLSEPRSGRKASQIVANLGVAALFAAAGSYAGAIAALAEASADTVSSEIGQAIGGQARLLTTWRRVSAGTDGGVTILGTIAGLVAAAIIVVIGTVHRPGAATIWLAACAGLFFDSFLGATIERRGWIGNDLVNFTSTLVAALIATALS